LCLTATAIHINAPQSAAEDTIFSPKRVSLSLHPTYRSYQDSPGAADAGDLAGQDDDGANEQNDHDLDDLARKTQNPVADLISLPFQNNTYFQVGSHGRVANVLNIQPVIPVDINDDWLLITRTIIPVVYKPSLFDEGDEFGLGDTQFTAFFSPKGSDEFIWGVGPVGRFPTATDDSLGSEKWSAGISGVALVMKGPWVVGGLVQNLWSYAGDSDRDDVNEFLLQPFINYNLDAGWYLVSAPIMTANWNADKYSDAWTIPVGGGVGRVFKMGKLPVNAQVQAFYNVEKPEYGPDWSLRVQFQLLFPRKKG
jgi:hypothetical protein